MDELPALRLTLASRRSSVTAVQHHLGEFMHRLGIHADEQWAIDLAVREAVANAVVHGNREDPGKSVTLTAEARDGWLVVQVEDHGAGFDAAELADPRDPEQRLRPHGRGVFLIRHLVDEVRFVPSPGGGTTVVMHARTAGPISE
ncbi:ATP-binding protein [Nannocystis sp. ILAH1]|uniref:ATP-binding protein n=1 Tax=unclassified Nannocystis TaxID=2627009 RepID=UPI00226FE291|nr:MULTISPECIES: ATP-binding protein [unclassified Nannocystis]MCY0991208.1 ATP-binding protein [Nannocystis sp. ILAH1]MCY1064722.1 ATP-binding protein [Nannocystis sp. RBIL2]